MPWFAPLIAGLLEGLLWLFKSRIGLFIATALVWLGVNFATMKVVMEPTINLLRGMAGNLQTGGASQFAQVAGSWLGVMNLDKALTMIISAYVARETLAKGRLFLFKRGVGAGG